MLEFPKQLMEESLDYSGGNCGGILREKNRRITGTFLIEGIPDEIVDEY